MSTGGPAYPQHGWSNDPQVLERMRNQGGMTLLDWMAGQALVGLLSKLPVIDQTEQFGIKVDDKLAYNREVAGSCYALAEAMLAEKARREALVQESSTTDHSGGSNKMVELEAQNRELVERIKRLEEAGDAMHRYYDASSRFKWGEAREIKP